MDQDLFDRAIVARIPALVKARMPEASGRRVVEVEASTEERDADGDVVLQEALVGSAASFVAKGHLDLDHLSEFGARMGIPDPASYIVGRPLNVTAKAGGRTFVEGEVSRSIDGSFDPRRNRYDEFWASLTRDPPVVWYASIYGFPTDLDDCTSAPIACSQAGATRYVIKAIDWCSLAFTRTPKNTALSSPTRIVTAKSYLAELVKAMPQPPSFAPTSMDDVVGAAKCASCGVHDAPSLLGYRRHFETCKGVPRGMADLLGHAMMHRHLMDRSVPLAAPNLTPAALPGSVSGL